ncbi:5-formyltetrahydrofolate cyclo-ligase [Bifidobacterium canis]|nr:5-formyltetrahydrofolate cyclo-ligase [Bifidobacterium canis]
MGSLGSEGTAQHVAEAKRVLRHEVFRKRKSTTASMSMRAGEQCAQIACESGLFDAHSSCIACHVSMGTEVSTIPLLSIALGCGYRVLVPNVGADLSVGWTLLASLDDLLHMQTPQGEHAGMPPEPRGEMLPPQALEACSRIIVPALLVNLDGVRLGRGTAWYDRALRYANPRATLTAMCWPWEFVDAPLPCEEHDVRMSAVLTPREYRDLRSPR